MSTGQLGSWKEREYQVPRFPSRSAITLLLHTHNLATPRPIYLHFNGNSVYVFLFWELQGLSPNFHIHVCITASRSNCHQLLAALGRRRKTHHFNHQTSRGSHLLSIRQPVDVRHFNHQTSCEYSSLQSPNLPWQPPPINQATGVCSPL